MTNNTNNNNNNNTKKAIAAAMLAQYLKYAQNVNVHVKAQKGVNSGAEGRALERAVNFELGLYNRSKEVQGNNKFDCIKYQKDGEKRKQVKIEIKSGAGTLATLNSDGSIASSPLMKSDFIAYVPRFYPSESVKEQVLFFEVSDFMDILKNNGLIRKKVSGSMNTVKKSGGAWYYDILSIQSFTNSKRKFEKFTSDLFFNGITFDDFIEWYGISK